jgi:hypothetical protein
MNADTVRRHVLSKERAIRKMRARKTKEGNESRGFSKVTAHLLVPTASLSRRIKRTSIQRKLPEQRKFLPPYDRMK